jgi:hypothetical protein
MLNNATIDICTTNPALFDLLTGAALIRVVCLPNDFFGAVVVVVVVVAVEDPKADGAANATLGTSAALY